MKLFPIQIRSQGLLVIILVGLLAAAILGTGQSEAWFSDTETVSALTIQTGHADLKLRDKHGHWVDSAAGSALGVNFPQNLYPGYEGSWNDPDGLILMGNKSTEPVTLDVHASLTNYSQSAAVANQIYMAIGWEGNAAGTGFHTLKWWRSHAARLGPALEGNRVIKIFFKVPGEAGNEISGAVVNFDLHLYAEQHH